MDTAVHLQRLEPVQGVPAIVSTAAAVGKWLSLSAGGVDWQVKGEAAEELRSVLNDLWSPEPHEVIKTGAHRTVFRRELPLGAVFVKHFRIAGWRSLAQNLVRPCKAELELRAVERVAALGIATTEVLAVGRVWRHGVVRDSFLVTRDLVASQLDQWLLRPETGLVRLQHQFRVQLAQTLGRVAGRLHAAGVEHTDFHPGNILIRAEGANLPQDLQLWLIDLHAARFRGVWSSDWAARSLAAVNTFFQQHASRTDQLRFFNSYSAALAEFGVAAEWDRVALKEFATRCGAATTHLWDRADRAWRRGNRHQRKLAGPNTTGRALAVLDAAWVQQTCEAPESLFGSNVLHWCKNTGKRRVARVAVPAGVDPTSRADASESSTPFATTVFAKCVESRGWTRFVEKWRTSRVRRAWEIGHAFLRRGLPTPPPLLFLEVQGEDLDRQYLVTAAIPESQTVAQFCRTVWPTLSPAERRAWLSPRSQTLARLVQRMHDCRYDHRDLKFENLLVTVDGSPIEQTQETKLWFLDLDAVHRWPVLPRMRRVQNLSRINVSALELLDAPLTTRLRFLRSYLGGESREWKRWWREIARKSQQKQSQNRSRGRQLS